MPPIRPEPIQLKPGIISGWVRPPVRTSEAPVMIDIVPSVTMNGLSLSPLVIAPLAAADQPAGDQRQHAGDPDAEPAE